MRMRLPRVLAIPALVAGMAPLLGAAPAVAQTPQIPSVDVRPVGTTRNDPNGGAWFVTNMAPGESKRLQVRVFNPANVPQTVRAYLADVSFNRSGLPEVANVSREIGTWGTFETPTMTVAPQQQAFATFTLTAPQGADPGDHVGAVVFEHEPEGTGNIRTVKRMAVRLYVTLPGNAHKDFEIEEVKVEPDSMVFPREATITVHLRNSGRVRLEPAVRVNGSPARGPSLLMSNGVERYVVKRPIPFWGGPLRWRVEVASQSLGLPGPARQVRVSSFVVPWHLLVMLLVVAAVVWAVRFGLSKRRAKYRFLQSDLKRIERLLAEQHRAGAAVADEPETDEDPLVAIRAAMKQARRAGDTRTEERLKARLDEGKALKERLARIAAATEPDEDDEPPFSIEAAEPRKPADAGEAPFSIETAEDPGPARKLDVMDELRREVSAWRSRDRDRS